MRPLATFALGVAVGAAAILIQTRVHDEERKASLPPRASQPAAAAAMTTAAQPALLPAGAVPYARPRVASIPPLTQPQVPERDVLPSDSLREKRALEFYAGAFAHGMYFTYGTVARFAEETAANLEEDGYDEGTGALRQMAGFLDNYKTWLGRADTVDNAAYCGDKAFRGASDEISYTVGYCYLELANQKAGLSR